MNLNQAQKDALAAGASMEEVLAMADVVEEAVETGNTPEKTTAAEPAADLAAAQAMIAELQASAVTHGEALATAQAALATSETALAAANAQVTSMGEALRPYVAKMSMILGSGVDAKALSMPEVLAQHAKLYPEFAGKYRPGKQSKSVSAEAEAKADEADFQSRMLQNAAAFRNM